MNIQAIHQEAYNAAVQAENDFLTKHGEMAYCGFAWVNVYVTRSNSKEAKLLKEIGFKRALYQEMHKHVLRGLNFLENEIHEA